MSQSKINENYLDNLGIICSSLCMVHCLLIPLIAVFFPIIASYFESEWVHIILIVSIFPIAITSFISSKKKYNKSLPLILGGLGTILLAIAILVDFFEVPHLPEAAVTSTGSILLITAHTLNIKYLNSERCK